MSDTTIMDFTGTQTGEDAHPGKLAVQEVYYHDDLIHQVVWRFLQEVEPGQWMVEIVDGEEREAFLAFVDGLKR